MPRSTEKRTQAAIDAGEQPVPGSGRKSRVLYIQAGRGKIRLVQGNNQLTAAGRYYEANTKQPANAWQPGIKLEGRKEYAFRANGAKVLERYRDNTGTLRVNRDGLSHFETHATQFLVEVPYVKWYKDTFKNKPPVWSQRGGGGYVSITDAHINALASEFGVDTPPPPIFENLEVDDDETHMQCKRRSSR